MIEKMLQATARSGWIVTLRLLGVAMVIAALVTAVLNVSWAGFTPIFLVLLGLAGFLGVICNSVFRIVLNLEKKS